MWRNIIKMVICLSPSLREKFNWVEFQQVGPGWLVGCKDCKGCSSHAFVKARCVREGKFASRGLNSCQTQSLAHID